MIGMGAAMMVYWLIALLPIWPVLGSRARSGRRKTRSCPAGVAWWPARGVSCANCFLQNLRACPLYGWCPGLVPGLGGIERSHSTGSLVQQRHSPAFVRTLRLLSFASITTIGAAHSFRSRPSHSDRAARSDARTQ
jgi:hypothetical protein